MGGMDRPSTPSALARGDAAASLPRLGGMARPDGVVIVSERFWAFAGVDGTLREGEMPKTPSGARRIPLVRGLVRLFASLSPLFSGHGVARRRERRILLAAILAPALLVLVPDEYATPVGLAITLALLAWMLRGRTLFLHGAEHRAIAAAEERRLVAAWTGAARPTRFSARCGTNFAALLAPVTFGFDRLLPLPTTALTPLAVTLVSLALTMELWVVVQHSSRRLSRLFLIPGLALQRVTTREPSLEETRVALRATESVLARELVA